MRDFLAPGRTSCMARKETVELIDDLDGTTASETVRFGLDGRSYEMELSAKNAGKLRKSLEPYLAAGRKITGKGVRVPAQHDPSQNAAIREWALAEGYEIGDRGRIAETIREAYTAR